MVFFCWFLKIIRWCPYCGGDFIHLRVGTVRTVQVMDALCPHCAVVPSLIVPDHFHPFCCCCCCFWATKIKGRTSGEKGTCYHLHVDFFSVLFMLFLIESWSWGGWGWWGVERWQSAEVMRRNTECPLSRKYQQQIVIRHFYYHPAASFEY